MTNQEEQKVILTDHSIDRAKERLGWSRKTLDRMAAKAYFNVARHSDAKGNLHKWLTKTYHQAPKGGSARIYGDVAYFFLGATLITLYQIPKNLRKLAIISISEKND